MVVVAEAYSDVHPGAIVFASRRRTEYCAGDHGDSADGSDCYRTLQPERNGRAAAWSGICDSAAIKLRRARGENSGSSSCHTCDRLVWHRKLDWSDGSCRDYPTTLRLR